MKKEENVLESALALSGKYGVPLGDVVLHITDLLNRFTNAALKDTCARVGGDPGRKLSPDDRMIGSSALALEQGTTPAYIAVGAAAGLHRYINEAEGLEQGMDAAKQVLCEVSKLDADAELAKLILAMYEKILAGATLYDLRRAADAVKAAITPELLAAHPEFMQGESVAPGMQLIVTYTQGTSSMQDVAEVRADGAADGSAIAIAKSTALAPTFMDKLCFWSTPLPEGAVKEVTITRAEIGMKPNAVTGWIVTGFFVVFISFYAAGPGVCVWLALSELMPTRIRANGMAIALLINQGVSTTIDGTFLPWVGSSGYSTVFFWLAGFTVIYFITAAFFLPETKGRTLEEIEQYFKTGKMPEKN